MVFDESRLDDAHALAAADATLRALAESGSRLRRGTVETDEDAAVARTLAAELDGPRAIVLLGPGADLVGLVLEPTAGVPVVTWTHPGLPGWVGGLDLVVLLAPAGAPDATAAAQAATAVRRGCRLLVVCGPGSAVAEAASGRWSAVLATAVGEPSVLAHLALGHLGDVGLAPPVDLDLVADALDLVAVACSPHREAAVNPAKQAATGLAESVPLVVAAGDTPLGARAAAEAAAGLRRMTGLPALGSAAAEVLPVVDAASPRTVFADPYDDPADGGVPPPRPSVCVLGDAGGEEEAPSVRDLREVAAARGVRVVDLALPVAPDTSASTLSVRAALVLHAAYAAAYLRLGGR